MELPPYRMPMAKSLLIHMWDRSKLFLLRMGQVILVGSIVIWSLSNFPRDVAPNRDYAAEAGRITATADSHKATADGSERRRIEEQAEKAVSDLRREQKAEQREQSYIGRIGHFIAPVFTPLGIDWQGGVALLSGFVAKEIVISTLGVLHAAGENDEEGALGRALIAAGMTPLSALSMMVFVLLYLPCLATTAAIRRETSTRWMLFSIGYSTAVAWGMAFIVYQGGRLLGFN
jgi:ferrous iron transport protein B